MWYEHNCAAGVNFIEQIIFSKSRIDVSQAVLLDGNIEKI